MLRAVHGWMFINHLTDPTVNGFQIDFKSMRRFYHLFSLGSQGDARHGSEGGRRGAFCGIEEFRAVPHAILLRSSSSTSWYRTQL
jgi:hypothetical protein